MTPVEIEAAIQALIIIGQVIAANVKGSGTLTDDEKARYLYRLEAVKLMVTASKFPEEKNK
jgi:hypothetical protein